MSDKPTPLSGFPELLPEHRAVEREVIGSLSRTFELHGFANIETRAVEPLDRLSKGGEVDKEIYVLRRLHAEEGASDSGLGLHFDLTVPFARYVLENSGTYRANGTVRSKCSPSPESLPPSSERARRRT